MRATVTKTERGIDRIGRHHDALAIVPVGQGAGKRRAEHERDDEADVERGERQSELGLLAGRGIEHLHQVDVQRESRHAAADHRQRLGGPDDHERAEPMRGRIGHDESRGEVRAE
jgi:hypothetical protein